jgi:hypothetical protein
MYEELKQAIEMGDLEGVRNHAHAAEVNTIFFPEGSTPLTFASKKWLSSSNEAERSGYKAIILLLLDLGANVHMPDTNGLNPHDIIGNEPDVITILSSKIQSTSSTTGATSSTTKRML